MPDPNAAPPGPATTAPWSPAAPTTPSSCPTATPRVPAAACACGRAATRAALLTHLHTLIGPQRAASGRHAA